MPGVNDFLFEGRPPPSVTTYGQTVESMPKWLSDYTQGLIARANAIGAEGYQPYGGPRIADFSPEEQAAFGMVEGNVGAYQPYLDAAGGTLSGGLTQAYGQLGEGTRGFPGAVDEYMDPYIGNVLNRQATLSNRNFSENTLPALQNAFTRAGHFGSDRMMDLAGRASRDAGSELNEQQLAALSGAYGQAGQLYGADAGRNLQAAGLYGNLGLEGSRQMGALGEMASRMGYGDAAAMEAIGRTQRGMDQGSLDLAYGDFQRQRDYPRNTIDWMSSIIRGLPYDTSRQSQQYGPIPNLDYAPSQASQLGSLFSTGLGIYDQLQGRAEGGLARYAEGGMVKSEDVKPGKGHHTTIRSSKILALMKQHNIPRKLATDLADGHATVETNEQTGETKVINKKMAYKHGGLASFSKKPASPKYWKPQVGWGAA